MSTRIADRKPPAFSDVAALPERVDGGGYQTALILMNAWTTTETTVINIFDDKGSELPVRRVGAASTSFSISYSIPVGALLPHEPFAMTHARPREAVAEKAAGKRF